jgi:hypothetical protein
MTINRKTFMALTTISLLLLSLAVGVHIAKTQSGTQVSGIIDLDTVWTGSYSLNGSVTVSSGVTLTIEAGTTVNLNSNNIQNNVD